MVNSCSGSTACFVLPLCTRNTCPMLLSILCVDEIQVEAERTEVLRLAAELNALRAASEQAAIAAREREAALKAMLASETEVSTYATAHSKADGSCVSFVDVPKKLSVFQPSNDAASKQRL